MKNIKFAFVALLFVCNAAFASSIIATIDGTPITDTDITARVSLMNKQGDISTDNRRKALQNIIDDQVKIGYARNFKISPTSKEVDKALKSMNLGELSATEKTMARNAVGANISWQMIIGHTIVPTIDVSDDDIANEKKELEKEHGLPIELTMVRLINIPDDVAKKLSTPKNCDDAINIAQNMGGSPQKITVLEYELSPDVRSNIIGLPNMTWSKPFDKSVFLICNKKKTAEYGDLDKTIKQNAIYKKAMFIADQQLKQLRRKSVIVINDSKYKI